MKAWLRALDALPIEATFTRYYRLQEPALAHKALDLTRADAWDELRAHASYFTIPDAREQWQRLCETATLHDSAPGDLPRRAYDVLDLIDRHGLHPELHSLGAGLASLEYHLKRLRPALRLHCSDYSPVTVERLRRVFVECESVRQYDLVQGSFRQVNPGAAAGCTVLIHRVDPHLTDAQWSRVFADLRAGGVGSVVLVPYRLLTLRHLVEFKRAELRHRLAREPLALAGYVRTRERWLRLWRDSFELADEPKLGYSQAFLLRPTV